MDKKDQKTKCLVSLEEEIGKILEQNETEISDSKLKELHKLALQEEVVDLDMDCPGMLAHLEIASLMQDIDEGGD